MADSRGEISRPDLGGFQLGRRPGGAGDKAARRQIEAWTRTRFGLGGGDTVLVAEVACGLPGCPPLETVVAFWIAEDPRRQFKIFKTVAGVREDDLPPRWMKDALVVREGEGVDCC